MKRILYVLLLLLIVGSSVAYAQENGISLGPVAGFAFWTKTLKSVPIQNLNLISAGIVFDAEYVRAKILYEGQLGTPEVNSGLGSQQSVDTAYSFLSNGLDFKVTIPLGKVISISPLLGASYDQFTYSKLHLTDVQKEANNGLFALAGLDVDIILGTRISLSLDSDFGFDFLAFAQNSSIISYKIDTLLTCNFRF